jgi:excisionase family DNA binding protein
MWGSVGILTFLPTTVKRLAADLQFRERPADSSERMLERTTVSIPRACVEVGDSRRTIYTWMASGKVQYVRTAGGSVRIFKDTLWRDAQGPSARPGDSYRALRQQV